MEIILLVIEKLEGSYSAYSPNLLGCRVEGQTREEVEHKMLAIIEDRLELLQARTQKGLEQNLLLQGPIEESIQCIGKTLAGQQCTHKANKEGLCSQHWHILFGHKMNAGSTAPKRFCLLCGYKEGKNEWISPLSPCPARKSESS